MNMEEEAHRRRGRHQEEALRAEQRRQAAVRRVEPAYLRRKRRIQVEARQLEARRREASAPAAWITSSSSSSTVHYATNDAAKRRRRDAAAAEDEDYDKIARAWLKKKNEKKKKRLMLGHDTNDMKGLCVTAAEDEAYRKTAPALLKKKGFDPDDLNKRNNHGWTPMIYYSGMGNLKMCRYLLSRGADCRKVDTNGNFPMVAAAAGGHSEIVQWLYHDGGAHDDIRKVNRNGWSPLRTALYNDHGDTWKWLILNGALSSSRATDGGMIMRTYLCQGQGGNVLSDDRRLALLSWAQDAVTAHDNFQLFLTGTPLFSRGDETSTTSLSLSASLLVRIFNGQQQPDLLELISQYVAEPRTQQQVRTLRQLVDRLPTFIADRRLIRRER